MKGEAARSRALGIAYRGSDTTYPSHLGPVTTMRACMEERTTKQIITTKKDDDDDDDDKPEVLQMTLERV